MKGGPTMKRSPKLSPVYLGKNAICNVCGKNYCTCGNRCVDGSLIEKEQLKRKKGRRTPEEINKEIQGKDLSWKKQKNYQKQINDLKADHSMEISKLNSYESKKGITTDQIETLSSI